MSAQTHTFPCPFCGRRMGVGIDLLGKHVRCPHCKQVVLAPANAAPPAVAHLPPPEPILISPPAPLLPPTVTFVPPPPEPPPPAPEPLPEPDPVFNLPREAADSILSEANGAEDDVFGSQPGARLPIPELPPPPPPAAPQPVPAYTAPVPAYAPPPPAAYIPPQPVVAAPAPAAASDPFAFDMSPPPPPPPPPPRQAHPPVPAPAPVPAAAPALAPTAAIPNPFAEFEPVAPPPPPPPPSRQAPAAHAPPAHAPAAHVPAPAPAPATRGGPANPWAGLDAMPAPVPVAAPPAAHPAPAAVAYPAPVPAPRQAPAPQPLPLPLPDPEPVVAEEAPAERTGRKAERAPNRGRAAAPSGGVPKAVVYGLAGYALLVTLLAAYALFLRSPELPPEHPLSTIPDNFGEFDPASRKGDKGKANANRFRGDGELPANLRAGLGGKIEVGQVEVEPLRVERRTLRIVAEEKAGEPRRLSAGPGLVLHLRVKNTSPDLTFCPLDPAFNRKTITNDDRPLTRIVAGGETFYGGPISWPTKVRQFEEAQKDDDTPLKPGESREYAVCSASDAKLLRMMTKGGDPVLWRVQLRRGVIQHREKEVPVTAIIGVDFKSSQIQ